MVQWAATPSRPWRSPIASPRPPSCCRYSLGTASRPIAQNIETLRTNCPLTLALGGIPIRVARDCAKEARDILAEAAEREDPDDSPPETLGERVVAAGFIGVLGMLAVAPPPRLGVEIVGGE